MDKEIKSLLESLKMALENVPEVGKTYDQQHADTHIQAIQDIEIALAPDEFICHDWAGWNEQMGRFTHLPSGDTLLCQRWMGQLEWEQAQAEWFKRYNPAILVHKCRSGAYRKTGDTMGSVGEIIQSLPERF